MAPTSGSGSGSVSFTVAANVTTSSRTGTLTIAGQTVTVTQAGVLFISTASLPNATANTSYSQALTGLGGITPYTWSVTAGNLPAGLSLNAASGVISGVPGSPSTSSFTVTLADSLGSSITRALSITVVAGPLTISCPAPGPITVGTPFQLACTASGGTTPYAFAIASGSLPPGLLLNASTGLISGTPTSAGQFGFTVRVADSAVPPQSATSPTITLSPVSNIGITCPPPGPIAVGTPFQLACTASGGTTPYAFAIASGSLPPGLLLNASTGLISGTPTSAGQFGFTVRVTDSAVPPQSATSPTITLSPVSTISITCPPPGPIAVGIFFQLSCSATGGATPYTFAIASGGLPPGLSINPGDGSISGIATTTGQFTFSVRVTSAGAVPQTATTAPITLAPSSALTITCLPPGPIAVGIFFQLSCSATGGATPYTFAIASGSLPPGLSINPGDGSISGIPTTTGRFTFAVRVNDAGSPAQSATSSSITLSPSSTLTITCPAPGPITVGTAFQSGCTASGGTPPYTFAVASGSLPPGLTLNAGNGSISGTPTVGGQFSFAVRVTDAGSPAQSATSSSITLSPSSTLTITCPAPGPIAVGTAFQSGCTASGGTPPYTFAVASGSLPPGLTLNAGNGSISGTPTVGGQFSFAVRVTDAGSPAQSATSSPITLTPAVGVSISCPAPGPITVGTSFQFGCTPSGGTPPYTFSLASGSLPPGLTLNTASGLIGGTPTTAGQFSFNLRVSDAGTPSRSATSPVITLSPASSLTINCPPAGPITVGTAFQLVCTASGGTSPYTFALAGGGLPPGLALNGAVISGTPTTTGQFDFSIRVTDSGSPVQIAISPSISLSPAPGLTISCPDPGLILVGTAFQLACAASGGTPPYTFAIVNGSLPPGLSLNSANGSISGTPATAGRFTFSVRVADAAAPQNTATSPALTLAPAQGLTINCPAPGPLTLGTAFQLACTAGGGTPPYAFAIASGSLPPGLSLNGASGSISGTPANAGQFSFSVKVTDAASPQNTAASPVINVTAATTLTISCPSPGTITVGQAFQLACTANGGTAPYSFAVVNGALPAGLSLNTANGSISGTPTIAGQFSFGIRVTDAGTPPQSATSPAIALSPASDLTISCGTPVPAAQGATFQLACTANGGTPPYTFSIATGSLPPGLSLNTATGSISGTLAAGGSFPFSVRLTDAASPQAVVTSATITIEVAGQLPAPVSIVPSAGAQGASVAVTIAGSNFVPGAVVNVSNPGITVTGVTVLSDSQIAATFVIASNANPVSSGVTVTTAAGSSTPVSFAVLARPQVTLSLPAPAVPTDNTTVGVRLDAPAAQRIDGTLSLSFRPDAAGVPDNFADPALQFIGGGTQLDFSIAAGSMVADLVQTGAIQQGTVAGQITITLTRLQMAGADVLPQPTPTQSISVRRMPPVITPGSLQLTGITNNSFAVVLTGYSTPRDLISAILTFAAASGRSLGGGTSVTVSLGPDSQTWFAGDSGRQNGSRFRLRIPFTFTGDGSALGSVTATLVNSAGNSGVASGGTEP